MIRVWPCALSALLSFFACTPNDPEILGSDNIMRPKAGPNVILSDTANLSKSGLYSSDELTIIKYLDPNYQLLSGKLANFENYSEILAIISPKNSQEVQTFLYTGVIQNNKLNEIAQFPLNIAQTNSAHLIVKDVLANHKVSAICRGLSKNGRLSIQIFTQIIKDGKINFIEILNQEAGLDIALSDDIQSAFYEEEGNQGEPVSITLTDRSQENGEEKLLKSKYTYSPSLSRYVLIESQKITEQVLQKEKISTLFKGQTSDINNFLDGVWYREVGPKKTKQLALFNAEAKTVQLLDSDRLENHFWLATQKIGGSLVQIFLENEAFRSIKAILTIDILDDGVLHLKIMDRTQWEGDFKRIDGDLSLALMNQMKHSTQNQSAIISGIFKSQDGSELTFIRSNITKRNKEVVNKGIWTSFIINKPIIEIYWLSEKNPRIEYFEYSIEESTKGNLIERNLKLTPAKPTIRGAELISTEPQLFIQYEKKQ